MSVSHLFTRFTVHEATETDIYRFEPGEWYEFNDWLDVVDWAPQRPVHPQCTTIECTAEFLHSKSSDSFFSKIIAKRDLD